MITIGTKTIVNSIKKRKAKNQAKKLYEYAK